MKSAMSSMIHSGRAANLWLVSAGKGSLTWTSPGVSVSRVGEVSFLCVIWRKRNSATDEKKTRHRWKTFVSSRPISAHALALLSFWKITEIKYVRIYKGFYTLTSKSIPGVARLFYSGAIFSYFEWSRGRKFIPKMRQINRGVEGFKIILKICLQICENLKRFLKCSSKMSYFSFKTQIFF